MVFGRSKKSMKLSADEKERMEDVYDFQSELMESGDQGDVERKVYPSDMTPLDFYQYKKLRIIPDASTDFPGVVDKDVVLSNIKGEHPDLQHSKFVVETIELFQNIFVKEALVPVMDGGGNVRCDKEGNALVVKRMVFDDFFNPVIRMLLAGLKFELTGSRAMGKDRESVLDITTSFKKDVVRKKEERGRIMGFGGGG